MNKLLPIVVLSSALTCGTVGVASAQWYPPVRDPNATYRLPGTEDFFSGREVFAPRKRVGLRLCNTRRGLPQRRKPIVLPLSSGTLRPAADLLRI
jgi:hypothetical protein